jgi:hypothetical protein
MKRATLKRQEHRAKDAEPRCQTFADRNHPYTVVHTSALGWYDKVSGMKG